MLLHAFGARAGAGGILAAAGAGEEDGLRFADVGLLSAVSTCFALGAATTEQFKHLTAGAAGPLAGLTALPGLRTLRPRLAALADAADPLELQAMFASAMLEAGPVTSGVYYVDDHFVPYVGARPVPKGWNNKRGKAGKGRADTHVTAHDGRAVCFCDRGAVRPDGHAAAGAGRAEEGRPARREDHARVRPGRRVCAGFQALPGAGRALGDLPARAAGRAQGPAGPVGHQRQRPRARGGLGREDRRVEGLRPGPPADVVRARPGRAADPDL